MQLSEINIYPIKSLGGMGVESAVVEDRGLQFDRRWMLVDEKRQFITQREVHQMAALRVTLTDDRLVVTTDGGGEVSIPFEPATGEMASVKVWSSSVKAEIYPDEINQWFSEALGLPCRLAAMTEKSSRKVNPFYAVRRFQDEVSFADGYPFMLIGAASLADLNEKIAANRDVRASGTLSVPRLKMNRFRPNFVVEGSEAFAEDTWKKIRIGEAVFHVVKPCDRCVITTINQETLEKGKEPLATLSQYRKKNGKVLFGQNLIADAAGGTVRVGDLIEVLA
jgi:hypothetical protein